MKTLIFFCLSIFLPHLVFSQNATFSGNVIEKGTSIAVENAIVTIEGTGLSTMTNAKGEFFFYERIPPGQPTVTVYKDTYITEYFLLPVVKGKRYVQDNIGLSLTKKEIKARKKTAKNKGKDLSKQNKKALKASKKRKEREDKKLAKETKKLKKIYEKQNDINIIYAVDDEEKSEIISNPIDNALKDKYGSMLNVSPNDIKNADLYQFIDLWIGTPYLMGGETAMGIDCSSFAQHLFSTVYNNIMIERTSQKQFNSEVITLFTDKESFQEGDLLFFGNENKGANSIIIHVGIYLDNNRFISATNRKGPSGSSGVKISNLRDLYWSSIFIAGGRRKDL